MEIGWSDCESLIGGMEPRDLFDGLALSDQHSQFVMVRLRLSAAMSIKVPVKGVRACCVRAHSRGSRQEVVRELFLRRPPVPWLAVGELQ